jgi:hypothetical protein
MGMKTANDDVYSRIKSGSSLIAAGVRLGKPKMEAEGRAKYAEAIIENAVRLYGEHLTPNALIRLSHLMYDVQPTATTDADEDATADAEETSAELDADLLDLRQTITPASVLASSPDLEEDPEDEYEEDFD